jgi:hypothetical protein
LIRGHAYRSEEQDGVSRCKTGVIPAVLPHDLVLLQINYLPSFIKWVDATLVALVEKSSHWIPQIGVVV